MFLLVSDLLSSQKLGGDWAAGADFSRHSFGRPRGNYPGGLSRLQGLKRNRAPWPSAGAVALPLMILLALAKVKDEE